MPRQQIFQLHPAGWETDPEEEIFPLSSLDYCVAQVFCNYALFFKLSDVDKPKIISTLREGLEITLSQCRQLCGVIDKSPNGKGFCFHKTRDSTVEFHVQWLDSSVDDPDGNYPSFEELEKQHFVSQALGNMETWCVAPMTYGEKPDAQPENRPKVAAFKATFIRGGMVFMMHHHHYANDVMGWAGELHQLAENCAAVWSSGTSSLPEWDVMCLDKTPITKHDPPNEQCVDGSISPQRHPGHRLCQWLLFHLPKSKANKLKQLAGPIDASDWISTYDAFMAYIWRILSKHRARLFQPDPSSHIIWGEAVDMRRRLHSPPVPSRIQGNVLFVALSFQTSSVPQLTVDEVISKAPLPKLAQYIRQLTNGVTQESLDAALTGIAAVRDKTSLYFRTDSFPPMSNFTTDWRDVQACEADFGFGRPHAFRFPFDTVTAGLTAVYPARTNGAAAGDDEGNEFMVGFEKELVEDLINDPEWNEYFEFRGVDAEEPKTRE